MFLFLEYRMKDKAQDASSTLLQNPSEVDYMFSLFPPYKTRGNRFRIYLEYQYSACGLSLVVI
jgi:hypothetical protein